MQGELSLSGFEVVSEGVDWITATTKSRDYTESFQTVCDAILNEEHAIGNFLKPWSGLGYQGYQSGQFAVGSGPQGFLVRATSDCARENWNRILGVADNVSRLDLQVTIRHEETDLQVIEEHLASLEAYKPTNGRKPEVAQSRNNHGGFTVYSGVRTSEWFGRIYAKYAESGDEFFRNSVRYEIEIKGKPAWGVAKHLSCLPFGLSPFLPRVLGWFITRGAATRYLTDALHFKMPSDFIKSRRGPTTSDDSLKWLATQVRPSVQRLIDIGRRDDVLRALGLDNP